VKNRCAWLNHSSNADAFIALVHRHPNIRLWFSGAALTCTGRLCAATPILVFGFQVPSPAWRSCGHTLHLSSPRMCDDDQEACTSCAHMR